MHYKCGVSEMLLRMLEKGDVTHPKIAKKVGIAYELSEEEINELLPLNYRPGEYYNPDKYVSSTSTYSRFSISTMSKEESEYQAYLSDKTKRLSKRSN